MQERQRLDPEEREVERMLAEFHPISPLSTNPASILFEAQRRRQRVQLWAWRSVAAVLALAIMLQFALSPHRSSSTEGTPPTPIVLLQPNPQPLRNVLPAIELPLTGDGYISTRNRELAFGMKPVRPPASIASPIILLPVPPRSVEPAVPSLFELLLTPENAGKS